MTSTGPRQWGIGEVFRRTGATERTLRCSEEFGLRAPARDAGGRLRYDGGTLDRLYPVRLLRELRNPAPDVNPDAEDLRDLTCRHLADLDARPADLDRWRETVRAVEGRLLNGDRPGDDALLDLLSGLLTNEPAFTRRNGHRLTRRLRPTSTPSHPRGRIRRRDRPRSADKPCGTRKYSVRDPEGHLRSFHTPLTELDQQETP